MIDESGIRHRWLSIASKLDERERRLWAAAEVQSAGHGALAIVSRITGIARSTINRGEDDLAASPLAEGRARREGGGGKRLTESDPTLLDDLKRLVEPATLGSPVQPLLWISKSRAKLAKALGDIGHSISDKTVGKLLSKTLGFSRQNNRKADEGSKHPDRNAQFEHINAKVVAAQAPSVVSIRTLEAEQRDSRRTGSAYDQPIMDVERIEIVQLLGVEADVLSLVDRPEPRAESQQWGRVPGRGVRPREIEARTHRTGAR